jgi:hypothetical protein
VVHKQQPNNHHNIDQNSGMEGKPETGNVENIRFRIFTHNHLNTGSFNLRLIGYDQAVTERRENPEYPSKRMVS